jgi:hypothetical protein
MTSTLSGPGAQASVWSNFRQAVQHVPPAVLHGAMALAVLGVLGQSAAVTLLAASPPEPAGEQADAPLPLAPGHRRARCEGCGVVEAIRVIDGQPATYAFTVRLKDNSIRTSITATTDQWRVGDRIIVMGGAGAP